jgi:hypothetical protein
VIDEDTATYIRGSALANLVVDWNDSAGLPVDLSLGHTFALRVGTRGAPAIFTKTDGIVGTATGLVVTWADEGEILDLDKGAYIIQFDAIRTIDGKPRRLQANLHIIDSVN